MSLSQGYPATFSDTQETQAVLKLHELELKKIYNDINAFMAANGHGHTGSGTDGVDLIANTITNGVTTSAPSQDAVFDALAGKLSTGGQIPFPATQNPSSDPNTLDDYEEGSWTPALKFGGNSVGITYSAGNQTGQYT